MPRIVKGYWNCKYCDSKGIDGLIDICPNCGKQKSEDVKYYMNPSRPVYVSNEELATAGINEKTVTGTIKTGSVHIVISSITMLIVNVLPAAA